MARFCLLLAVLGLMALGGWLYAREWAPDREAFPTQGVSVSSDNGSIDWGTLAAQGTDFAYIRASRGGRFRDPAFEANWAAARAAGMRYGAALDFSLCASASEQATGFMAMVPRDNAALPPVIRLAFEPGCRARPGQDAVLSELNTLINLIESHAGTPVLLNVSDDFDARYAIASGINRTLWLDRNFFAPDSGKRRWVMWTANDMRHIDGVDGPVRWDVMAR
ncbi:glycoside hydrolase family 25 protein [Sphingobium sp. LSP13-1-1.1]|uniref:glycoside hydrolase family 25 protein n=1 Tax=Sphingobium sp. LSP13-1-1.1 TaxID=3135234 RepID=UPI00341AFE21